MLAEIKETGYPQNLHLTNQKSSNAVSFGGKAEAATASAYLFQSQQAKLNSNNNQLMLGKNSTEEQDSILMTQEQANRGNSNVKPP